MNNIFSHRIRWQLCCLIFFAGCDQPVTYKKLVITKADSIANEQKMERAFRNIHQAEKELKTGFLITRTGNDFTSEGLRSLNQRNQTYSHCGIVSIEHDSVFVYHALGGEWNPDETIRRDPLLYFADPYNNRGIGIFSFGLADSAAKNLLDTVRYLQNKPVLFDMNFDLLTDDRMYCAEFVYKAIEKGTNRKITFPHSHIRSFEFVGIDDIFLHPGCVEIRQIVYK